MSIFESYLSEETGELRKLIVENPDLPIVVLAGEEANGGDHCWTFCSSISFGLDEILDCDFHDAELEPYWKKVIVIFATN